MPEYQGSFHLSFFFPPREVTIANYFGVKYLNEFKIRCAAPRKT